MLRYLLLSFAIASVFSKTACDVLCSGPILEAVCAADPPVFNDSKTFVDLVLLKDPEIIIDAFTPDIGSNRTALIEFLATYFAPIHGTDVHDWLPDDFPVDIPLFSKISDPAMQKWARGVHNIWKTLGKTIDNDVYAHPFRHTLLPLKYPHMIVPGGRFIEFYYWDSYWIIKGLLISQMNHTAIMVVENLLQALPVLSAEYNWWMQQGQHAVTVTRDGVDYILNRFYSDQKIPRPESAREDTNTAAGLSAADQVYAGLAAGAESGWDYSSRWLGDGATLRSIDTLHVIPADLNGVLFRVETVLGQLYDRVGLAPPVDYNASAAKRKLAIFAILWDPESVQWRDYNLTSGTFTPAVVPSNFQGLWAGVFDSKLYGVQVSDIAASFVSSSGLIGPGGVCTSLLESEQQWDYPNVWPPLVSSLVDGFEGVASPFLSEQMSLSESLATIFLQGAMVAFNETHGYMLEKYNCSEVGALGGGGEYDLQTGFGWTNGVVLSLLDQFPNTPAPPGFGL